MKLNPNRMSVAHQAPHPLPCAMMVLDSILNDKHIVYSLDLEYEQFKLGITYRPTSCFVSAEHANYMNYRFQVTSG